ncbi:non-ribosomal peptide synthetase [Actinomadura sp. 6K520]|uniref:non-ribosomal peptide synthetase n=1 Tax=Actinomadura sp. 6K520 TaxID=2530364 RepID=UPI00104AEB8D|nr:non-ribosomal peptide synthetase [Actinomadura sp. 6K520]TDE26411.1 amino acid adenylation domain-containing protein [Actinomadura sp. 6K520]
MGDPHPRTVSSLLADLAAADVRLKLVGRDRIEVTAPRGRLSAELRGALARHKTELLEWLAQTSGDGPDAAELPRIVPDKEHLYEPFTPPDLQMSFLMGGQEGFEYHVRPHQYMEFDFDELDPVRYEEALNRAIQRQRDSIVVVREDMRVQTVRDPAPVTVTVSDLRDLPDAEAQAHLDRVRARLQREEPPHDRWPWLHPHICLYGEGRARLHWNNNNVFTDAPSGTQLINDAMHYYHHPDQPLPELELSFRDQVLALNRLEESPLGLASKKYWCDRMAGWPDAPDVPLASGTAHRGRSMLYRREILLPPELWSAFKGRAEARGLTLTNALLGAHAEVLAYWSGSRHFLLNNMITHRLPLHPESWEVLGQFASLYPLEVDWRHDEDFTARVRRLQAQVMADVAQSHWSGASVLQELNRVRRTPGRAICPFAVGSALFVGPTIRPFHSMLETPQTLLDTEFWELRDGRLWVIWDVIEAAFPDGLIDAMSGGYRELLTRLAEDDRAWERTAAALFPAAQAEQRAALNGSAPAAPPGLLHDALPRQAAERPDAPAVIDAAGEITFAGLHDRVHRLAARLRGAGARPGDLVAVALPKGHAQMVAVLAAPTAGAAYVPIDLSWPEDRIGYLLTDTGAAAVVTDAASRARLAAIADVPVLAVDDPGTNEVAADEADPDGADAGAARKPEDLAYVIYTSGSTGRPKGAMLDHRGPLNTVTDINARFGIRADDVVFGVSSLCFDLSVYDIFGSLAAGATLVLPPEGRPDPASWIELMREHGVTVWNSVPALMQLLVEEATAAGARFPALRTVLLSGDWIPVDLPDRIRRVAPNASVISLGGATEASIWSIHHPIAEVDPDWTSIPYGRPLAGQTWHVLDDQGRDAPTWVTGHLHIGGVGVAMGYLGDPERTRNAFVAHPRTGERLYRTGDLGRYLPNGDIEFLGRADFQVKIQGFRVEPGEIEHGLLDDPRVRQAAVVARSSGAGRQLAAFVVGADGAKPPEPEALRARLAERLPGYMVPHRITVLDALPLTGNGKLDRRALEGMGGPDGAGERVHTAPRNPTEAVLAEIWESLLDAGRPIGVDDDFFDLGGQSFAALRVIAQVAERLGRRIPLGTMLERATIAGLAAYLETAEAAWSPLVRLNTRADGTPWCLVHPAGGGVLCYQRLAESLDRPGIGFQAPGPADGRKPLETVEELADLYVGALLEERPRGPYLLGGWSSGAVIAFEMAHRLEDLGETVERLVVIDAPAPVAPREVDEDRLALWFLEDLGGGFDPGLVPAGTPVAGSTDEETRARLLALAGEQGVSAPEISAADLAAALAVFRGVVRACNSYRAPVIAADVTVLRAQDGTASEFAGHPCGGSPDWGWARLTRGAVDTAALPGTHHTLLTDPRAGSAVAAEFNRR